MKCHAGAGHHAPAARGSYGELCDDCWARVVAILARIGILLR